MKYMRYEDLRRYIIGLLDEHKIIFIGEHTNDWFNFLGRAVQLSGYFCHTFYVSHYNPTTDELCIIEADGETVKWTNFDKRYRRLVQSGKSILTVGFLDSSDTQFKLAQQFAEFICGSGYSNRQNIWHGFTTVLSWCGNLLKVVAGQLDRINPLAEKGRFNCSSSCTFIARQSEFKVCVGQALHAVTPTEFMTDILLKKDVQSIQG